MPPHDGVWLIASKNRPDVGNIKQLSGRRWGATPRWRQCMIAQHCDSSSAAAKPPGGGTAAIVRWPLRGMYTGVDPCIPNAQ